MASRPVGFHPEAELELTAAAEWYEERKAGAGADFVASVRTKIGEVREAPERWPNVRGVRRALVNRFPFAVIYRVTRDEAIQIVAIAHLRRRPKYWSPR